MWFKVDDTIWSHPKFLALSDGAIALWLRAGAYCAQHLTDGYVSDATLRILGASKRHSAELVAVGLWDETIQGYEFHDWHHYQPTRESVLDRRRRESEKKAKQRSKANKHPGTGRFV